MKLHLLDAPTRQTLLFLAFVAAVSVAAALMPPAEPGDARALDALRSPFAEPAQEPTEEPTQVPTEEPTPEPTEEPTVVPTEEPTVVPTEEPTPTSTPVQTQTPTPEPTEPPEPEPAVSFVEATVLVGSIVRVSGTLPASTGTYTLCLVANASWTEGGAHDCADCVLAEEIVAAGSTFSGVPLGELNAAGGYDVLLLDGGCAAGQTVLAVDDAGTAPGLVARQAQDIPAMLLSGAVILLILLGLSGVAVLRRL